jgi:K+-transporting ATPase ATPase C chain
MRAHLRASLWLLVLTVLVCCVVYPAILWVVGQTVFHDQADGSLIRDGSGKVIGSRLIAQPFTGDEYFQPRPSAAAYNAAASGASNWGANNPLLRDRVARQLGPIVKYAGKNRPPVGPDVEKWFQSQPPDFIATWAKDHGAVAEQWLKDHLDSAAAWLGKETDAVKSDTASCSQEFFVAFAKRHPGAWPAEEEVKEPDNKTSKKIKPVREGPDVQAYLFDPWLQQHSGVKLEQVPADMVMASGSGLDPHITLKNALYQLDRVAGKWADKTKLDKAKVRKEIEDLLNQKVEAPLGGLVGVKLVNVLEINLVLREHRWPTPPLTVR